MCFLVCTFDLLSTLEAAVSTVAESRPTSHALSLSVSQLGWLVRAVLTGGGLPWGGEGGREESVCLRACVEECASDQLLSPN